MTEILINATMFLAAALALAYTPWAKRVAGNRKGAIQTGLFTLLVIALYVFSLIETIEENGWLYGVSFSFIPLLAGAVILRMMKLRPN